MKEILIRIVLTIFILLSGEMFQGNAEENVLKSVYGDPIHVKEQKVIVSTIKLNLNQKYLAYENDLVLLKVEIPDVEDKLQEILGKDAEESIDILTDISKKISPQELNCEHFRYLGENGAALSERIISDLLDQGKFILLEKSTNKIVETITRIEYSAGTGNLGIYGGTMYLLPTGDLFFEMLTWTS